jgi:hypothetical protein
LSTKQFQQPQKPSPFDFNHNHDSNLKSRSETQHQIQSHRSRSLAVPLRPLNCIKSNSFSNESQLPPLSCPDVSLTIPDKDTQQETIETQSSPYTNEPEPTNIFFPSSHPLNAYTNTKNNENDENAQNQQIYSESQLNLSMTPHLFN